MSRVLIPLATGFEELEAITLVDLLRRADIDVVTAGLEPGPIKASRGTLVVPDTELSAVMEQEFDMIVLPGGLAGANNLDADPRVHRLLQRHAENGAFTAAICAAPKVLANAGLLHERSATAYPGTVLQADYPRLDLVDTPVVIDGHVVTSRGPGTAMDFALTLIALLLGEARRDEVETALLRPASS
jgi:4-methyl-5(b-hydroxyethyl)-thiazole monophosphate biosynthesis